MEDIITALATAWGEGGIAIVRLSGKGSLSLADSVFSSRMKLSQYPPRHMALGKVLTSDGEIFDEVLAVRFEENKSYTGEESVEIHCHGGSLAAQRCIEELCARGARTAHPGEFTRRAFTNGRMDLAQAESVLGIIRAKSDEALTAANRTLQGKFSAEIKDFLGKLTELAAKLEVNLDFPEEDEGFITRTAASETIEELISCGNELQKKCKTGMALREGIKTAIIGKPNVGKSSLLNALLCEERAIVTSVPGTTRDNIEETVIHMGVPIRFIDTAGIRATDDIVESAGVTRSRAFMAEADLCLLVLDSSEPISEEETALLNDIKLKKHLVIMNKNDLPFYNNTKILNHISDKSGIVYLSSKYSCGIEELKDRIVKEFTSVGELNGGYAVTARQMNGVQAAAIALSAAKKSLDKSEGDDVTISCIADARASLASVLGIDPTEDLIERIFGDFCVGK